MYMAHTSLSTLTPLMENGAFAPSLPLSSERYFRSVFYVGMWFVQLFPPNSPPSCMCGEELFLPGIQKRDDKSEGPSRPPVKKRRVAENVDLLQSGRMRQRIGRGIRFVDRQLLRHGFT